mmetsp:Transcript_21053/g.21832  ORF Transcript_21053/g.21832 Transcript_21053/m.21832 type:complete len:274 (-) Transcript_21053:63-884(-)
MSKIIPKLTMLCFAIIFALTITCSNSHLVELSDHSFHETVLSSPGKWLVMFHLPTCPHCKKAEQIITKLNEEINLTEVRIATVDCDKHNYICMGFEIRHVPTFVKVIEGKFVQFSGYPAQDKLKEFINQDHEESEMSELPDKISYFGIVLRVINEASRLATVYIQSKLDNYEIGIKWEIGYTYALMIGTLVALITTEVLIIVCCCNPNKEKKRSGQAEEERDNKSESEISQSTEKDKAEEGSSDKNKEESEKESEKEKGKAEPEQDPVNKKNN